MTEGQPNLTALLEELGVEAADEAAAREIGTDEPIVLSASVAPNLECHQHNGWVST